MASNVRSRGHRKISETGEELCPVCSDSFSIFAIASCDHVICYSCSTRMRALCDQLYCPICRHDASEVYFSTTMRPFSECKLDKAVFLKKFGIYCETKKLEEKFWKLLEHRCRECDEFGPVREFQQLQTHVRKVHNLFFCEICVTHLKIFSRDRRTYSRQDLARHRRIGDVNDSSQKGHPLCEFCEERYLDDDELFKHLRKEHYYCHFCDTDHGHQYYSDYDVLLDHFRQRHFVCEEEECRSVQFTNVFKSVIDLKAHRSQSHAAGKKRSAMRQDRILDVPINVKARPKPFRRGRGEEDGQEYEGESDRRSYSRRPDRDRDRDRARPETVQETPEPEPDLSNEADFPTIPGSKPTQYYNNDANLAKRLATGMRYNAGTLDASETDYPSLPSSQPASKPAKIQSNKKSAAVTNNTNKPQKPYGAIGIMDTDDFPALGGAGMNGSNNNSTAPSPHTPEWTSPVKQQKKKAVVPAPVLSKGEKKALKREKEEPRGPQPVDVVDNLITEWDGYRTRKIFEEPIQEGEESDDSSHVVNEILDDEEFPSLGGGRAPVPASWVKKPIGFTSGSSQGRKKGPGPKSVNYLATNSLAAIASNIGQAPTITTIVKSAEHDSVNQQPNFTPLESKSKKNAESKGRKNEKETMEEIAPKIEWTTNFSEKKKKPTEDLTSKSVDLIAKYLNDIGMQQAVVEPEQPKSKTGGKKKNKKKAKAKQEEEEPKEEKKPEKKEEEDNGIENVENLMPEDLLPQKPGPEPKFIPVTKQRAKQASPRFGSDDFPALGNRNNKSAPPGFKPPGLQEKHFEFTVPSLFSERNFELIQRIQETLHFDDERFSRFKVISGAYRQGTSDAQDYYQHCKDLLGDLAFRDIFLELLVLLPDIPKQNELYDIHLKEMKRSSRKNRPDTEVLKCPTCKQIVKTANFMEHEQQHGMMAELIY